MYAQLIKEITNIEVLTASVKQIVENFSANSAIMIVMMIFCVVGGIDKIRGNKYGYGEKFDEAFGARPIKRYVSQSIETMLAMKLINEEIVDNSTVVVKVINDKLEIEKQ